jgi:NitT/TauT family transport system permease protein
VRAPALKRAKKGIIPQFSVSAIRSPQTKARNSSFFECELASRSDIRSYIPDYATEKEVSSEKRNGQTGISLQDHASRADIQSGEEVPRPGGLFCPLIARVLAMNALVVCRHAQVARTPVEPVIRRPWRRRWLEFGAPLRAGTVVLLGISIWVIFFGIWQVAVLLGWSPELLLPAPWTVLAALDDLFVNQGFIDDVLASIYRIVASFAAAAIVAVPLGILMGSFRAIDAFFSPLVSGWRYLPAPSFIPLLLMWLGTGELQKLALLFIGVVWFLITLIADHTKAVRRELVETAMTLGAARRKILLTVIVPAAMPNIVVAMRQMLAVSWTYLVIAEIVTSTDGIGAMMMRAKRFVRTDEIMAGIVTIGVLGLLFDFMFRALHRVLFPYIEDSER